MSPALLTVEEETEVTTTTVPDPHHTLLVSVGDRTGSESFLHRWYVAPHDTQPAPDRGTTPTWRHTGNLDLPETSTGEDVWGVLQIAAELGDELAFLRALAGIDWLAQSSSDFVRAVRLALAAGAHMAARRLAQAGNRLYPSHPELAKMARILAAPRVLPAPPRPARQTAANQQWLRRNYAAYRGKWVALRDGKLVAAADSVHELRDAVPDLNGLMVTVV